MKCSYCYEDDKNSQYSWEDILPTLTMISQENSMVNKIEFIGGEPLLRFDLLKGVVEYFKAHQVDVKSYTITTNGTILNKEIIEFLKDNENINFYISIDGTKSMNQLRLLKSDINSYDLIVNNFNLLKREIDVDRIVAHMVVHLYNVSYLRQGIEHLGGLGFKKIDIGIIEKTMDIDRHFKLEFIKQFKSISHGIVSNDIKAEILQLKYKPFTVSKSYICDDAGKVIYEVNERGGSLNTIDKLKKNIYDNHIRIQGGI